MSRRRTTGFFILSLLLLALLAGGFYLRQTWQQLMQTQGIESLEWNGIDASFNRLTVARLEVVQVKQGRQLKVEASSLALGWQWSNLRLTTLSLDTLDIDWQNVDARPSSPNAATSLTPPEIASRWLPYEVAINSFEARVPCATGHCELSGALKTTRSPDLVPTEAVLDLEHGGHKVRFEARLEGQSWEDLILSGTVTIDGKSHIELESRSRTSPGNQHASWRGAVMIPRLPQADWLLAWLQKWHPMSLSDLPAQPDSASMKASWELTGPTGPEFFQNLSGDLAVSTNLPQPWPIPGIGTMQGSLKLALVGTRGHWQPTSVDADLKLQDPGNWTRQLPEFLRPHTLDMEIRPAEVVPGSLKSDSSIALNLAITGRGQARVDISSSLAITTAKPWTVQTGNTRIDISVSELNAGEWRLQNVALGISVSGHMDEQGSALTLGQASTLEVGSITNADVENPVQLKRVQADLSQLSILADYHLDEQTLERWAVKGPLTLASAEVNHPLLRSQSWRFKGILDSDVTYLNLAGTLSSRAGASAKLDIAYPFEGDLIATGKVIMDGEASAQAVADTLAIWPQNLKITSGQVSANANLRLPSAGPLALDAELAMNAVSGIFNRTAWTASQGDFDIGLTGSELAITMSELTLEQVNPGVPLGPVRFAGSYSGSTADPFSGQLRLDQVNASFLGGSLNVAPNTWSLADLPMRVPVDLNGVELSQLMRVYPAEGLAGTGTLTGQVPVLIDRNGLRVERGKVTAIKPGGTLKLPADRLRGIAQGNQAIELVARAMENFHYSALDSTIDYDQDGRLFLGLHLEGSNPDVRDGYPIVLNINIEEDIPALLTSLQLSGRVNEAVTERVRELMQEREARQDNAEAKN